jgi:hypothetical protein
MTAASVIGLSAFGLQDKVIRGVKVQLTLWKAAHTRFTNFTIDWQEVTYQSTVQWGSTATATFTRYADLITGVTIEQTLPALDAYSEVDASDNPQPVLGAYYVQAIGFADLELNVLEIGGTIVDSLTAEDLWMYDELFNEQGRKVREVVGRFDWTSSIEDDMIDFYAISRKLYTELPFYFSAYNEPALAVPMVALTRHEIKLKTTFAALDDLVCSVYKTDADDTEYLLSDELPLNASTSATIARADLEARVLVKFVYISDAERDAFTEQELQYLIIQNQHHTESVTASKTRDTFSLALSHPVTFATWRVRPSNWNTSAGRRRFGVGFKDRFDYSMKLASSDADLPYDDVQDPFTTAQLKYNSHVRWPADVDPVFYRKFLSQQHARSEFSGYEYIWSYALKIYEFNPTSTENYSKIDNMTINFDWQDSILASDFLFQVANYNQIIIRRGLLGLRFAD